MIDVSIIGGSGYAGGELLRLLIQHPEVKINQVISNRFAGEHVSLVHPNLRFTNNDLKFSKLEDLKETELLFVSLPNGESMKYMDFFMERANRIIDLGADFRLKDPEEWEKWYGIPHQRKDLLGKFVYGLPEIHREKIRRARYIAGPGCEATATILSLYPFLKNEIIDESFIIVDAKMSSSQAGNKPSESTHHPERAGAVRSYKPVHHRHTAEIEQELSSENKKVKVAISATAIEMVRGLLVTIHARLKKEVDEKEIWKILRNEYQNEPFIRIVCQRRGLYRFPEPKILMGTNFFEIGFAIDKHTDRLVIIGALDNLTRGTAGQAVQCMNIMFGLEETTGLNYPGLHPV